MSAPGVCKRKATSTSAAQCFAADQWRSKTNLLNLRNNKAVLNINWGRGQECNKFNISPVAHLDSETSNELFEVLADWNTYLEHRKSADFPVQPCP